MMKQKLLFCLTTGALLLSSVAQAQLTWQGATIGGGDVKLQGYHTDNGDGTISITGGGWDIWGGWDAYYYYYTAKSGVSWDAIVRVQDLQGPDHWTKAELMVHRIPTGGSGEFWRMANWPFVAAMTTRAGGENRMEAHYRPAPETDCRGANPATIRPSYPNTWLKIARRGSEFIMYTGTDGATWTEYHRWDTAKTENGFTGIPWENEVYVGIAVTAHNNDDPNGATALVSNLDVVDVPVVPPTQIGATSQPTNQTVFADGQAMFYFATTNNGYPELPASYQWYKNGQPIPGATGQKYTGLFTSYDNNAEIFCRATSFSLTLDSAKVKLTVTPGTLYNGVVRVERFNGGPSWQQVQASDLVPGPVYTWTEVDRTSDDGANYGRRVSGYFIAPATDNYFFYINSDDESVLYLSTDDNPNNKRLIAEQSGWSNPRAWNQNLQKCSLTYSPDGMSFPYASGFDLVAGQRYYFEAVHREGGGGDNLSMMYRLTSQGAPMDEEPGNLRAASNNIAVISKAVTSLAWVTQPPAATNIVDGQTLILGASATTDSEFPAVYQWFKNGVEIQGATSATYSQLVTPADEGAKFKVVAKTQVGGLTITSQETTLSVQTSVFEPGFVKVEGWSDYENRAAVVDGTAPLPTYTTTAPGVDMRDIGRDRYTRRVSGFFIPPTSGNYVFFINSDDDSALYLGTNSSPSSKRLIAEQTDWANALDWVGGGGNLMQKRSDSWSPDNGMTMPGYPGYALTAGTRYYFEVVHHEGTGGDNVQVTYKLDTEADPMNGDQPRLVGNRVGISVPRSRVTITKEPQPTVAAPYTRAVLTVDATTDSTTPVGTTTGVVLNNFLMYQWQKNGVDIPGATARSLSFLVTPADNNATFRCKVRSIGLVDASMQPTWVTTSTATVTVSGVYEPGWSTVEFWYNQNTKNNVLSGSAGAASYVTTSPAYEANSDGGGDPAAGGVNDYARRISGFFSPPTTGRYTFYVTSDDDSQVFISTDMNPANKYLICEEVGWSGGNRQWQSAGDANNPLSKRRSDQWAPDEFTPAPYAEGIQLQAGQKYYLEVVHHEGGGGDYVQVTYTKHGDPAPQNGDLSALTGNVIGTYVNKVGYMAFATQPSSVVATEAQEVTFTAQGVTDATLSAGVVGKPVTNIFVIYQWQKNGVDIPGANQPTLKYQITSATDHNASFVCKIRALGYADASNNPIWSNSQPAVLTIADTTAPAVAYATYFTDINTQPNTSVVDIQFSERMDAAGLNTAANYSLPAGLTITGIQVRADLRAVRLTVTGTPTLPFNVGVSGLKDYNLNSIAAGATAAVQTPLLISQDIGFNRGYKTNDLGQEFLLKDPQFPSVFWVDGPKAFTVTAQGSDIWNTNDGFNFSYEMKTGDFDVAVRHKKFGKTSNWAKGGLMVRETLSPSSRHWSVLNTPSNSDGSVAPDGSGAGANTIQSVSRTTFAGSTSEFASGGPAPSYPNAWLRIKRAGNTITTYSSTNGVDWVVRGTQTSTAAGSLAPLPDAMYVGIATTGHNNDEPDVLPQRFWNTAEYADYGAVAVTPVMQTTVSNGNLVISWSPAGGTLQSSPTLGAGAVWTDVSGAGNPATIPVGANSMFFRVKAN